MLAQRVGGTSTGVGSTAAIVAQLYRSASAVAIALEECLERRRQRRALLELSDAMLKDIGLSRGEAMREATKPFWRS